MSAPLVLTRPQAGLASTRSVTSTVVPQPVPEPIDETADARIADTARSLAVACLEIFAGIRRAETISRWVDRDLLDRIDQRARLRAELAPSKSAGDVGPTRTLHAVRTRVCRVTESAAEVTVIIRTKRRYRAVAIRLELLTTRWTMTRLETM